MLAINNLPNDLLSRVFTCLPFKDLLMLISVCHKFRSSVSVSFLWTELSRKTWYEMAHTDSLDIPEFGENICRAIRGRGSMRGLAAVELSGAGEHGNNECLALLSQYAPQLQRLGLGGGNHVSDVGLCKALESCQHLREISILDMFQQREMTNDGNLELTENVLSLMGKHCKELQTLRLIGFSKWFCRPRDVRMGQEPPKGVHLLGELLSGCPNLEQLTLTKTINRRWNDVCPYAVALLRRVAAQRALRVELCSQGVPTPLDVSCGICGTLFYEKLKSYVHVPGNQRHITSELCTDADPILAACKRGGTAVDLTQAEEHSRLRCCNLCQPVRYWLIDNGTPEVNRFGHKYSVACGPPHGGPGLAKQSPSLLDHAWKMMDHRWTPGGPLVTWAHYDEYCTSGAQLFQETHVSVEDSQGSSEDDDASEDDDEQMILDMLPVPFLQFLEQMQYLQQIYETSQEDDEEEGQDEDEDEDEEEEEEEEEDGDAVVQILS